MGNKKNVCIIFGGKSSEHEVSIMSAKAVVENIDKDKYNIVKIGINKQGTWMLCDGKIDLQWENNSYKVSCDILRLDRKIDIVFPVLHGKMGEDGTIQGLFEILGIPYVGASVLSSAVSMDKEAAKIMFKKAGIPTCKYFAFNKAKYNNCFDNILKKAEEIGYPCFVKPANAGSSIGVSKVKKKKDFKEAVETAFIYDDKIIVEEYVTGREIECSVLGNDAPKASLPGEIIASNEFYDYNAKYVDGKSVVKAPADIAKDISDKIREYAIEAFKAVFCSGPARVDFFYDEKNEKILINEINTMPGFTKISMYPKLWEASGISLKQLIDRLIELGFEKHNIIGKTNKI